MPKELTWLKAIDKVLGSSPTPLHYNEITEQIISDGLRANVGAAPTSTVRSLISASIKRDSKKSPYIRISKGTFTLKNRSLSGAVVPKKLTPNVVESEEQYEIITSFGMYWKKDGVKWGAKPKTTPKLLGMQKNGAIPVNFCEQRGIYLLYDGREVIYIGRTTDRALGKRLYEHTKDRMSERWDRFSWFGLLPVKNEDGSLGSLPATYDAAKLIPAFESILIEAFEPRQNRKRGDDLAAVEYLQKIDPKIEQTRAQAIINAALR